MGNQFQYRKLRPPYIYGLLCLFPGIGGVVGIWLLLIGLRKYKDNWLSLIGALGIVFTVFSYCYFSYYLKTNENHNRYIKQISQSRLNILLLHIEKYKLSYGKYPLNIRGLMNLDEAAPIYDPIQENQRRNNKFFYYEQIGGKYFIFSAGQDGIPYSQDDLFPEISISDSSKVGFIKPTGSKQHVLDW